MKTTTNLFFALIAVFIIAACQPKSTESNEAEETEEAVVTEVSNDEEEAEEQKPASPRKSAEGSIADVAIVIDYGSPSVKGREVWGGLEAYGKVWRAGANETTSMEFDKDVTINGQSLPAGKYGFFIIPNEEGAWVAIFNEEWSRELHDSWGAYNYNEEKDVLRVEVEPTFVDENQEALMYNVGESTVDFAWEKARLSLQVAAGM